MNTARHVLAVLILIAVPISICLWYAIHPFARFWRRIGPAGTYLALAIPFSGVGWLIWRWRDRLLGADLGTQPALIAVAVVAAVFGARVAWSRRRLLTQRVLVGVPELSRTDRGRLITDGIYARLRNPRYVELLAFVFAYVCVANYAGTWVVAVLLVPAIQVVVLLEERELRERFGAEYDAYCRRVPRWIPRREGKAPADHPAGS